MLALLKEKMTDKPVWSWKLIDKNLMDLDLNFYQSINNNQNYRMS